MESAESESWKQKYIASLDKLERREKQFQEIEDILRTGISRVALAAQGVDRNLDRDLAELRKIVRRGQAYDELSRIVNNISDSVKVLEDNKVAPAENAQAACLLSMLQQLDVGDKFQKQKSRIEKSLQKLRADQAVDRCLQQTVELCNTLLNNNLPSPKKSWLQNFFGPSEDMIEVQYEEGKEPPPAQFNNKSDPRLPLLLFLRQLPDAVLHKNAVSQLEQSLLQMDPPIAPQNALSEYSSDMQKVLNQSLAKITAVLKKQASSVAAHAGDGESFAAAEAPPASTSRAKRSKPAANAEPEHRSPAPIEQFCIQLLESLSFPDEFQVAVNALRNRIVDGLEDSEISGVVHALVDLVMATRLQIESERNELQQFLAQLNGHLELMGKQIVGMQQVNNETSAQGDKMAHSLGEQIQHLQSAAQQANDLSSLKVTVREQVIGLRQHFEKQQGQGQLRHKKVAQALAKAALRLQQLEQESTDLKKRLDQEHLQSLHDSLTGIYNRLAYQERVDQEFARWKRYRKPLSLIIFDVDNFKRINDSYGHKAGDKALRMIAKYLKQTVRESDFVARYGGEEFIVIMPETSVDEAVMVANKLREKISDVYFHYADEKVVVSISAGIAGFGDKDNVDSVFARADQALYQAKHNGRNQCVSAEA